MAAESVSQEDRANVRFVSISKICICLLIDASLRLVKGGSPWSWVRPLVSLIQPLEKCRQCVANYLRPPETPSLMSPRSCLLHDFLHLAPVRHRPYDGTQPCNIHHLLVPAQQHTHGRTRRLVGGTWPAACLAETGWLWGYLAGRPGGAGSR